MEVTWANCWNGVNHRYEPPEWDERVEKKPPVSDLGAPRSMSADEAFLQPGAWEWA